eukprot:c20305_g1_i7.p1 GENE.c20305_g1_i7~~c20305_g1_i7.p1  ORF type:complete len:919 (-),score=181.48 c20305_g1_i7:1375-4131(-)
MIHEFVPHSLRGALQFCGGLLNDDISKRFFAYQLLTAVNTMHERGVVHGAISPHSVHLTNTLWVLVDPPFVHFSQHETKTGFGQFLSSSQADPNSSVASIPPSIGSLGPSSQDFQGVGWLVHAWCEGRMSNLDYLLKLNHIAGRYPGDGNSHPIVPWVIDFCSENGAWRDFTKTQFRINKSDAMLDSLFDSNPIHPHHITEPLTEIQYFVYAARQTPKELLLQHVRPMWEPLEYPQTIQRMYQTTPDECIPEFFTDASVFKSIHPDMPDLKVPEWCRSAEDFIARHRECLESRYVSERLHHWIDLTFGYMLSGEAAISAKNVTYHAHDTTLRSYGFVQLFTTPHPPKRVLGFDSSAPSSTAALIAREMDQVEQVTQFAAKFNASRPVYRPSRELMATTDGLNLQAWDLFATGCVIAEVFTKVPLFSDATLQEYLTSHSSDVIGRRLSGVPPSVRMVIEQLTHPQPSKRSRASELLRSPTMFPEAFRRIWKYRAQQHASFHHVVTQERSGVIGPEEFLESTLAQLPELCEVDDELFVRLVLPTLLEFFSNSVTQGKAVALIGPLTAKLGPQNSRELLMPSVMGLFRAQLSCEPEKRGVDLLDGPLLWSIASNVGVEFFTTNVLEFVLDALHPPFKKVRISREDSSENIGVEGTPEISEEMRTELHAHKIRECARKALSHVHSELLRSSSVAGIRYLGYPLVRHIGKEGTSVAFLDFVDAWVRRDKRFAEFLITTIVLPHVFQVLTALRRAVGAGPLTYLQQRSLQDILVLFKGLLERHRLSQASVLQCFVKDNPHVFRLLDQDTAFSECALQVADIWVDIMKRLSAEQVEHHMLIFVQGFIAEFDKAAPDHPVFSKTIARLLYTSLVGCLGHATVTSHVAHWQRVENLLEINANARLPTASSRRNAAHQTKPPPPTKKK